MSFANVKLILAREIRDQLRDRRTLFMIAVLPVLLYPLLGLSLFQVAQFMRQQATRVLVVGAQNLEDLPPLFDGDRFSDNLFKGAGNADLLELVFASAADAEGAAAADPWAEARSQVRAGKYEAALYFPPDFAVRLEDYRENVKHRGDDKAGRMPPRHIQAPKPEVFYNSANEKSQITNVRLMAVLHRWTEMIVDENLAASGLSVRVVHPFSLESTDVADGTGHRNAAMWSKSLPVMLLLWALTGAFYPAIDLCAGEKERGTLETLLCSPAQRSEIVVAKLLTVMLFSVLTAALNLLSMWVTGGIVLAQLDAFSMPPLWTLLPLGVALLPIAALFSAICLAIAAFARSSKEGQYYLMPVLLATMPLVVLPMSPGAELNFGNSLIPVTGVMLLLRSVLEGDYWHAVQFLPTVVAVTLVACLLSIRWAVEQFNSEEVLFREGERFELRLWLRHLVRDRRPTPTAVAAVGCGLLILVARFFFGFSAEGISGFSGFARMALITQLAVIAGPALLLTFLFTRSPRQTLLLRWPSGWAIPAAVLLAVVLHPAANVLPSVVAYFYPINDSVRAALAGSQEMFRSANLGALLLVLAVAPAICEELAFRGFILSGLRHIGHKWRAIVYSAIFFGLAHGILQQSLIACLVGTVLAYLAVQTGSLLPGMAFHFVHNSLAVINARVTPAQVADHALLRLLAVPGEDGGCTFAWTTVLGGVMLAALLLAWFSRRPYEKYAEEVLVESLEDAASEDNRAAAL